VEQFTISDDLEEEQKSKDEAEQDEGGRGERTAGSAAGKLDADERRQSGSA